MTPVELAEQHSEMIGGMGDLARAYIQAHEALEEINKYNRLGNDLDSYLFDLAEWGMGERDKRPNPKSFVLPE